MDEPEMTAELLGAIQPYRDLLIKFVAGEISAEEFEPAYLRRYLADESMESDEVFDVVDRFFSDVDEFVSDASLRAGTDAIGPGELRNLAEALLRRAGLV